MNTFFTGSSSSLFCCLVFSFFLHLFAFFCSTLLFFSCSISFGLCSFIFLSVMFSSHFFCSLFLLLTYFVCYFRFFFFFSFHISFILLPLPIFFLCQVDDRFSSLGSLRRQNYDGRANVNNKCICSLSIFIAIILTRTICQVTVNLP